jgi:hypothetical protein
MSIRHTLAAGVLATACLFGLSPAHAADSAKKDPQTGKNCVRFIAAETTNVGQTRMIYRNTCSNAFEIRIQAGKKVRQGSIEAGSAEKPSTAYITCRPDDRCDSAKWVYE